MAKSGVKNELIKAVLCNKVDRIQELLDQGADVNETEELESGSVWSPLTAVVSKRRSFETKGIISLLIQKGANVNWANKKGQTALVLASHNNDNEAVKLLIGSGADVNHIVQGNGNTPLILAANNFETVKILLDSSADVGHVNKEKQSALMVAAKYGSESVVELLLKHNKFNIDSVDNNGWSALWYASYKGHCNIIKMLLRYGADINKVNAIKQNVVMLASCMKQLHAVEILLHWPNGVDVNHTDIDGNSALMMAVFDNNFMEVDALLQHGADVNQVNEIGWTPVLLASQGGYNSIVALLLKHGANIHHVNHDERDALAIALQNANVETAKLLLNHDADANRKYSYGWTSLMIASTQQHTGTIACIELLIEHSVDVNEISEDGWDALGIASYQGHSQIVEHLLLRKACDKNIGDRKATALMLAALNDHTCIIDILVNKGEVDVNQINQDGVSALMVAAQKNNLKSVQELLKYGADVKLVDSKGRSALQFAFQNNSQQVIQMLTTYLKGMIGPQNYTIHEYESDAVNQETCHNYMSQTTCDDANVALQHIPFLKTILQQVNGDKSSNKIVNLHVNVINNFLCQSVGTIQTPCGNNNINYITAFQIENFALNKSNINNTGQVQDFPTFDNSQKDQPFSNTTQFIQTNVTNVTNLATDNSTINTS